MSMMRTIVALGSCLLVAACGLEESTPPPLTGPSDFALSVTLAAVPDTVPRDGSSQSVVTVTVRDASGRPVAGQRLSVSTNLGTVLQSDITTGSDGRASFAFVAPAAGSIGDSALIRVVPVGTNAEGAEPRTLRISFAGVPNATAPVPSFTVTPVSPEVGQVTTFNASASTDEGGPCLDACTYTWALGTEATRTGRIITYAFQNAGIQSVTLTMRDAAGTSASAQQNVTVTAAARPTVTSITIAPALAADRAAGQPVSFTANTTVAANHRITRFDWNWGDGSTSQTANAAITHTFNTAGTFVVTLTVTDDLGQTASLTVSVAVGSGVIADFTTSPTDPQLGETVQFDGAASRSTGGATITEWTWDFGDGSDTVTESDPRTAHAYALPRTYVVRLTVKDSTGRTGTITKEVEVAEP